MIEEMPAAFTFAMLREAVPGIPETIIRRALRDLKKEGRIISHMAGIKSYWEKIRDAES
jgi:DNA-binding HxlR family transcriptional regulator